MDLYSTMTKVICAVICFTFLFAAAMSAASKTYQDDSNNGTMDLDIEMIMNECNETFRIDMAYLESLNTSGSFVDETDRTPKCFIRCMLERTGVQSPDDGSLNPARAAVLFAGERNGTPMDDIGDMTAACATDRNEKCRCDKAYMFMRCLMSKEIEKYEKNP